MHKKIITAAALLIMLAILYPARAGEGIAALDVNSPAFVQDGRIPVKYTCSGEDVSPPLAWTPGPAATASYALIVDDPDAPGGPFTHWLVYDIPATVTRLEEHVAARDRLDDGTLQGKNHFGRTGYGGPCPPPGSPHHYRFNVYALDTRLKLEPGTASKDSLMAAMRGHILAQGGLTGVYER